jgi:cell wall-associated NlpC family hydrolase
LKNIIFIFIGLLVLSSCKSKSNAVRIAKTQTNKVNQTKRKLKKKDYKSIPTVVVIDKTSRNQKLASTFTISDKVVSNALNFKGTKYQYGGSTSAGMDCSGLIFTSFNQANINLPRTSFEQSKKGVRIPISKVKKGDLLFFKTSSKNVISHVGLVVNAAPNNIEFIHSSSSKGVIITSLNETYWSKAFSIAKRFF